MKNLSLFAYPPVVPNSCCCYFRLKSSITVTSDQSDLSSSLQNTLKVVQDCVEE